MNRKLLILCIVFFGLIFSAHFDINAQRNAESENNRNPSKENSQSTPEPSKTDKINITPQSKTENEILEEINFARTKPAEYARLLEEMRVYFNDKTLALPGRKALRTNEGVATLNETIEVLKTLKPLEPLAINCSAIRASRDQLIDLQKSGAFSHFGSDGSSPEERLEKYLGGIFLNSENLVSRSGTGRDIVVQLLLDDGLPSRPHRKNLLDSRFKFAGVSNGENIKNKTITVVVLSDSSADKELCEMK